MRYPSGFEIFSVAFAVLIGFFGGVFVTSKFPLPFPDQGHRLFGVRDEKAAETIQRILAEYGGIRVGWKFDAGPTHQNVMSDRLTVLAWFDKEAGDLSKNAISVAVDDPMESARDAYGILQVSGYTAMIHVPRGFPPNTLVLVETNAFVNAALVFRRPWWKMPAPKIRE